MNSSAPILQEYRGAGAGDLAGQQEPEGALPGGTRWSGAEDGLVVAVVPPVPRAWDEGRGPAHRRGSAHAGEPGRVAGEQRVDVQHVVSNDVVEVEVGVDHPEAPATPVLNDDGGVLLRSDPTAPLDDVAFDGVRLPHLHPASREERPEVVVPTAWPLSGAGRSEYSTVGGLLALPRVSRPVGSAEAHVDPVLTDIREHHVSDGGVVVAAHSTGSRSGMGPSDLSLRRRGEGQQCDRENDQPR